MISCFEKEENSIYITLDLQGQKTVANETQ